MSAHSWTILPLFFVMATSFSSLGADAHRAESFNDIEYSRVDGQSLFMDASLPSSAEKTPAVILVHGGGWIAGSRRLDVQPLFKPLSNSGFAWFSIDYRLASDVSQFGVAIDDVEQAVRYVRTHASEFNVDPNRIALIGESAGGQLAAMAALRAGPEASVRAVVALYSPTDLVSLLRDSTYVPARFRDAVKGTPWKAFVFAGLAQLSPL